MAERWTEQELRVLRREYPTTKVGNLTKKLEGRTKQAIQDKASREGISKHEESRLIESLNNTETPEFNDTEFNNFISGFVAGEGCFTGSENKKVFQITLTKADEDILHEIREYFGAGTIYTTDARKESWGDEVNYRVQGTADLWNIVVPFFDKYGFRECIKQDQYNEWRSELKDMIPADVV